MRIPVVLRSARVLRFLALLFAVVACSRSYACSCALADSACGAAKPGGYLFLGEVLDVRPVRIPAHVPMRPDWFLTNRVFRIHVVESFSNEVRVGDTVEVLTGNGGGDCGYPFERGKRYLVDAFGSGVTKDGPAELQAVRLGTGICTRTSPEQAAAVMLSELRTEMNHVRQPDLHGAVTAADDGYLQNPHPVAGVAVSLTAQPGGARFQAVTGQDGTYSFASLPAGKYAATFSLPPHQVVMRTGEDDARGIFVTIPKGDGTNNGTACRLSINAGPSGGIMGRVVDASGRPANGNVAAHLRGSPQGRGPVAGDYPENGVFHLEHLPDGDYDLEYDNYTPRRHATGYAEVRDGQVTRDIVITLPPE